MGGVWNNKWCGRFSALCCGWVTQTASVGAGPWFTKQDTCWQCQQEAKGSVWFIGVRRCLSSHSPGSLRPAVGLAGQNHLWIPRGAAVLAKWGLPLGAVSVRSNAASSLNSCEIRTLKSSLQHVGLDWVWCDPLSSPVYFARLLASKVAVPGANKTTGYDGAEVSAPRGLRAACQSGWYFHAAKHSSCSCRSFLWALYPLMERQALGIAAEALAVVVQSLQHAINRVDDDRDNPNPPYNAFVVSGSWRAKVVLLCCLQPVRGQHRTTGCWLRVLRWWNWTSLSLMWAAQSRGANPLKLLVKQSVNVHLNLAPEHSHSRIMCEIDQEKLKSKEKLIMMVFPADERCNKCWLLLHFCRRLNILYLHTG